MFTWTESVLVVSLIVVVCAWLGGLRYRRDEKREDRDRVLIQVAAYLREAKLKYLAEIVTDVAVRDWDGLYRDIKALSKRVDEPGELLGLLNDNFRWQLAERVDKPEWREAIEASLGKPVAAGLVS